MASDATAQPCHHEAAKPGGARSRSFGRTRAAAAARAVLLALALAAPARAQETSQLELTDMTFVGSRDDRSEIVLRARRALFHPGTQVAELEEVSAVGRDGAQQRTFELRCERAKLNLESNDFSAEGKVEGSTSAGERYAAPWVRYDHTSDVLYTEAPVSMVNDTGTFRGDGFRYHVDQRRFRLLGNVRVVQTP
jgi:LPS export ABC transporter protein LptC